MADPVPDTEVARRSGRLAVYIAVPVAVVVILLVVVLATRDTQRNRGTDRSLVGELAPLVEGETAAGAAFDIDDMRGRWVIVNFFATWCPPCVQEHPELVEFSERHADGDAVVVSVAFDDSPAEVEQFFVDNGGDWPLITDDTGRIAIDYGVTTVPETYVVAPSGFVADKIIGGVTADGLDAVLDAFEQAEATS